MTKRDDIGHKYAALATVRAGTVKVPQVLCRFILPKRPTGRVQIVFRPSADQLEQLRRLHQVSVHTLITQPDGVTQVELSASTVYLGNSTTTQWAPDISESVVTGDPADLRIVHRRASGTESKESRVVFWISPNGLLAPATICTTSYDGTVSYDRSPQVSVDVPGAFNITFDKHFRSTHRDGELRQRSDLVAVAERLPYAARDTDGLRTSLLPQLDDILLLASFATRTRTACVGWMADDSTGYVRYYRRDISIPTGYSIPGLRESLVPVGDLAPFLKCALAYFLALSDSEPVRRALYAIVPSRPRVMEADYLSLFAGLEELLLMHRRAVNLDHIIPKADWPVVRDHIKAAIKASPIPTLNKQQRSWMYSKVDELNRIPLDAAFDDYRQKLSVPTDDLWPVSRTADVKGSSLSTLYTIRNRLIHGPSFPRAAESALSMAAEHLRWTIERFMLTILGWPIEQSDVAPLLLAKFATGIRDYREARARLSL